MGFLKELKNNIVKLLLGNEIYPIGLLDLNNYFRIYGPINFQYEKQQDNSFVAYSTNFQYGSIITSAPSQALLDDKIKDAILTRNWSELRIA